MSDEVPSYGRSIHRFEGMRTHTCTVSCTHMQHRICEGLDMREAVMDGTVLAASAV